MIVRLESGLELFSEILMSETGPDLFMATKATTVGFSHVITWKVLAVPYSQILHMDAHTDTHRIKPRSQTGQYKRAGCVR